MRIAEIFHSIQGEGLLAGVPSIFIRTSGCNLRCHWCDTPYASWKPEGPEISIEEILKKLTQWNCDHVVLTGGEPMIAPDLHELATALKKTEKAHYDRNRRHYSSQQHSLRFSLNQPQAIQLHALSRTGPSLGKKTRSHPPATRSDLRMDKQICLSAQVRCVIRTRPRRNQTPPLPLATCPLTPNPPHARGHRCENARCPLPMACRYLQTRRLPLLPATPHRTLWSHSRDLIKNLLS